MDAVLYMLLQLRWTEHSECTSEPTRSRLLILDSVAYKRDRNSTRARVHLLLFCLQSFPCFTREIVSHLLGFPHLSTPVTLLEDLDFAFQFPRVAREAKGVTSPCPPIMWHNVLHGRKVPHFTIILSRSIVDPLWLSIAQPHNSYSTYNISTPWPDVGVKHWIWFGWALVYSQNERNIDQHG